MEKIKKLLNKLKKSFKENYVTYTVVITVSLIIIATIIIASVIYKNLHQVTKRNEQAQLYTYFITEKTEYDAKIYYEDDSIVNILADEDVYDSSIIYVKDKEQYIVPKQMSIVLYTQNNMQYKLDKYARIVKAELLKEVYSDGVVKNFDNFYIFDGEGLYFFLDEVELTIDGQKTILKPGSYVKYTGENVIYYEHESSYIKKVDNAKDISVKMGNYVINVVQNITIKNGKPSVLLSQIKKLKSIREVI